MASQLADVTAAEGRSLEGLALEGFGITFEIVGHAPKGPAVDSVCKPLVLSAAPPIDDLLGSLYIGLNRWEGCLHGIT